MIPAEPLAQSTPHRRALRRTFPSWYWSIHGTFRNVFPSCSVLRYRFSAEGPPGNAIPPGDLNAENDRADGRASFLRAPDTVAPPVALEPDNSPYRAPETGVREPFGCWESGIPQIPGFNGGKGLGKFPDLSK